MYILARVYATTMLSGIMFATNHCSFSTCVTSILKTLETCIDKGDAATAPDWHKKLKAEWWRKMVEYILYASTNGSLRAVEYFTDKGQKPDIRYMKLFSATIFVSRFSLSWLGIRM